ncbi:hypothetical protein NUH88_17245 [Nisaea acidiphila]|uniref:DUF4842 domain-containing protein n=1 Tax=Nisaea acidiphila TaxID=1862145 RepID=A0A9J7ARD1_9PROT|nr:hypothetical protein [Nisaea acidiphila]UUX49137.1 hypothetical protein NUH88_17245 [Nisaea acidiphila]
MPSPTNPISAVRRLCLFLAVPTILCWPAAAFGDDVVVTVTRVGAAELPNVVTGMRQIFQAAATCDGNPAEIDAVAWSTNGGSPVAGYNVSLNSGAVQQLGDMTANPQSLYFSARADAVTVTAAATVTCGQVQQVNGSLDVQIYGAILDTQTTEDLTIGNVVASNKPDFPGGAAIVIELTGADDGPGIYGDAAIELDEEIEDLGGTFSIFQVIASDNSSLTYGDPDTKACLVYTDALDHEPGGVPYESEALDDGLASIEYQDSPNNHFFLHTYPDITETVIDLSFVTTLMYLPPGVTSIYVPVAKASWSFSGTGTPQAGNYAIWNTANVARNANDFAASNDFPTWDADGTVAQMNWQPC